MLDVRIKGRCALVKMVREGLSGTKGTAKERASWAMGTIRVKILGHKQAFEEFKSHCLPQCSSNLPNTFPLQGMPRKFSQAFSMTYSRCVLVNA